ncbi:MAG TPA: ABC transporter permease [Bryobacterales bacterium]|nr:ABC transporter permease [Bryobacterales bacterium]
MLSGDLAHAARALRKNPALTLTAAATIALGIGASTAIFSVTNAVLLRPLPYKNPDRLVLVWRHNRERSPLRDFLFSNADFFDLRDGTRAVFEDIGGVCTFRAFVPREDGATEQLGKALVTTNFFRLMGAKIAVGRDFMEADGQPQPAWPAALLPPGSAAILSYEYWQGRYGGNPAVIGHEMISSGQRGPRIVGVLEPGFKLFFPPSANTDATPDFWVANNLGYDIAHRNLMTVRVIGRLKDGISLKRAQEQIELVAAGLRKNVPWYSGLYLQLQPMQQHLVAEARPAILALMGAVMFLLLIACANVANLLLVRASLRERELAVRAALGAGWGRLIRHMLAEAVVLSALGTLAGLGLAWLGIQELLALSHSNVMPGNVPRLESVSLDWRALAFAALAGLAAGATFGVMPAWRAARPDLMQALHGGGRATAPRAARLLRNGVVIAEVALAFVLLIGSGLMFRSFLALRRINPGYSPHGLLTFFVTRDWPLSRQEGRAALLREIQERLRALPGVENAAASVGFPLAASYYAIDWATEPTSTPSQAADVQYVLPGYFETMRIPLLAGRTFTEDDNAPGRRVAVLDQFLAAKAFPNESAVGKRIFAFVDFPSPLVEVIGVVAHQRLASLAEPGREQIYFLDGFVGIGVSRYWAIRTAGDPAKYAAAVRAEIAKLDRQLVISRVQPMDALVERAQAGTRFSLLLIGMFAAIAALLAGVGIYGVLSTVVRQRTAEIGVRIALGATPAGIFRLVVGHGLRLSAAGIAIGLVAALGLTRVISSMLVGVKATDPTTFAAMAVLFFLIAAIASWLPARRAAGLDPAAALREE